MAGVASRVAFVLVFGFSRPDDVGVTRLAELGHKSWFGFKFTPHLIAALKKRKEQDHAGNE